MFKHEQRKKGTKRRGKFNLMTILSPIKDTMEEKNCHYYAYHRQTLMFCVNTIEFHASHKRGGKSTFLAC